MIRLVLAVLLIFAVSDTFAQGMPGSFIDYNYRGTRLPNDTPAKKWSVTKYSSLSTSFMFSKAGSATIVSAPFGIQLNRRLTSNLYAFAGGFIAPSYVSFRGSAYNFGTDKFQMNPALRSNALGIYSRAELGLMYVNDEKTFSISGSLGIERRDFGFPSFQQQPGSSKALLNR